MTADLFDSVAEAQPSREEIADGAVLLRGFVKPIESELIEAVRAIVAQSPFRRMTTPGGHLMSVAMTNCGERGWITDHTGYRYDPIDPRTEAPWPAMPPVLRDLARRAAEQGGFQDFAPDACLVNRYEPGTRLSLHQDKDELDYSAPIVSVSLGLPATFLFGGMARADKPRRYPAGPWRRRGLGRSVQARLSRRGAARRGRARAARPEAHQSDFSQNSLIYPLILRSLRSKRLEG